MAYSDTQIRNLARQLEQKGAPPSDISEFVRRAKAEQGQQSIPERVRSATTSIPRGFGKTAVRTLLGGGELVERAGGALVKGLTGREAPEGTFTKLRRSPQLQTRGIGEKIGGFAAEAIPFGVGGAGRAGAGLLTRAGRGATQFGAITALQTGGDVSEIKRAGAAGAVTEVLAPPLIRSIGKITGEVVPKLSRQLEKSMFRLTPTEKSNLAKKIEGASRFMSKEKVVGSPRQRFEKVSSIYENTEEQLQNFLSSSLKNNPAQRASISQKVLGLKAKYSKRRDAIAIDDQIDDFVNLLETKHPEQIALDNLNELKRSTFVDAFNKAGTKVSDEVEFDIATILKEEIENIAEGAGKKINGMNVRQFNQRYGDIINARRLLKAAIGRSQSGFFSRLAITGAFAGAGLSGGPVGAAVSGAAAQGVVNQVATPVKSALSAALSTAGIQLPEASLNSAVRSLVASILSGTRQDSTQE